MGCIRGLGQVQEDLAIALPFLFFCEPVVHRVARVLQLDVFVVVFQPLGFFVFRDEGVEDGPAEVGAEESSVTNIKSEGGGL